MDFKELKSQVSFNIIGSILLIVIFLITLISTFTFLESKILSLVPLFSLFIISISIVILVVNIMRYRVAERMIDGMLKLDIKFLKLLILKVMSEEDEVKSKKKDKEEKEFKIFSLNNSLDEKLIFRGGNTLNNTGISGNLDTPNKLKYK